METLPLVTIPLPVEGGGVGVAQVMIKEGDFPTMTVDPPPEKIAAAMGLPHAAFAPREEGTIQLILGQDKVH
jgi:hypothetical protein